MAMQALRDGASQGILKFFLLGLLALAGGGLVFTDVGGFFSGGVSSTDVAKVGKEKIGLNSFDRVARRSLQQLGITPAQAYKLGYMDQILRSEIQRRSLMKAATDSDIRVGKDYVVKQIRQILAPAMASGMSAEQALENLTRGQGISESELTTTIISERTLSLFGDAMEAGALYTPPTLAEKLYAYNNEERDIRYIAFPNADYKDIEEPSEEQLTELYENTKERFAAPERRTIKVIALNTDTLADTLTIEESQLRDIYENDIVIYTTPPSRTIAQAIFTSEEAANEAKEQATPANFNEVSKDANADIIPSKTFTEDEILDELQEPVFTAENETVVGPIETPLGWSLVNITKISEENVRPFDEVKSEIREDIVQNQLIDEIYKLLDEVDEFFAVGGTVEEAKEQFNVEVATFEGLTRSGQNAENETPLNPAYGPDAGTILESAYEYDQGMTGPAFEISGGKFIAVNTASVTPKSYAEFEEVEDVLKTQWMNDQRNLSNKMMAISIQKEYADKSIEEIAKSQNKTFKIIENIKRGDEQSPLPITARNSVFGAKAGEHFMIEIRDGVAIAEVTEIVKPQAPDEEAVQAIQQSTTQAMQNELFALYMNKLQEDYPAKINNRLLDQVYGEQAEESF